MDTILKEGVVSLTLDELDTINKHADYMRAIATILVSVDDDLSPDIIAPLADEILHRLIDIEIIVNKGEREEG